VGEKKRARAKERKKLRVVVLHGKPEMPEARARVSQPGQLSGFTTPTARAVNAIQSALGVGGCEREIFISAASSLQFAMAGSAATQPQQKKFNSADVQWGAFIPRGDLPSDRQVRVVGR
jgi:hypothetical protein